MSSIHSESTPLIHLLSSFQPSITDLEIDELVKKIINAKKFSSTSCEVRSNESVRDLIIETKLAAFDLLFQKKMSRIEHSAHLLVDRMNFRSVDPKELVSELYCAARDAFPDFIWINEDAFIAWTTCIMRRQLIREFYKSSRKNGAVTSELQCDLLDPASSSPSQQLSLKETNAKLEEAIETLSEQEQQVLKLRYVDFLTASETGNIVGITEANVRQIAKRARHKISVFLASDHS